MTCLLSLIASRALAVSGRPATRPVGNPERCAAPARADGPSPQTLALLAFGPPPEVGPLFARVVSPVGRTRAYEAARYL